METKTNKTEASKKKVQSPSKGHFWRNIGRLLFFNVLTTGVYWLGGGQVQGFFINYLEKVVNSQQYDQKTKAAMLDLLNKVMESLISDSNAALRSNTVIMFIVINVIGIWMLLKLDVKISWRIRPR